MGDNGQEYPMIPKNVLESEELKIYIITRVFKSVTVYNRLLVLKTSVRINNTNKEKTSETN